jgi:hypothetical protein
MVANNDNRHDNGGDDGDDNDNNNNNNNSFNFFLGIFHSREPANIHPYPVLRNILNGPRLPNNGVTWPVLNSTIPRCANNRRRDAFHIHNDCRFYDTI